ncbi:MAG: tandem-95 repeat protein, partial [Planctomycetaceae bacterium]|nr:tandem-95 repeat protein [Planctomycetaceae bacterium]
RPTNDAPVLSGPTSGTVDEDSRTGPLVFSAANGNAITAFDVDAEELLSVDNTDGGRLSVTLTVAFGTLTLTAAQPASIIATDIDGSDGTLSFRGLQSDIDAYLDGLAYNPNLNFNNNVGSEVLTILVNDQGNSGEERPVNGVGLTDGLSISISVVPINDPPHGSDATIVMLEDGTRAFTEADFGFSDADDAPAPNAFLSVRISSRPTVGTLAFDGTPVVVGDEIAVADLSRLTFRPAQDRNGSPYASFTFQVRDNGGTLNNGVNLDATPNTITFNVTPLNDTPLVTLVNSQFTLSEAAVDSLGRVIPQSLTGVSVSDVDEDELLGTGELFVTVTVLADPDNDIDNGTVVLTAIGSATVNVDATPNVIGIAGTEADVNATLATLAYTAPSAHFNSANNSEAGNVNGLVFVVINVDDLGNTGSDGPKNSERTITLTVVPVNDAPEFTLSATPISIDEDVHSTKGAVYSAVVATSIRPGPAAATDESTQTLSFNLTPTNITGNLAFVSGPAIDATTGALTFQTSPDANGTAVIEVVLVDDGGVSNGGVDRSPVQRFTLTVNPVNDMPLIVVDASLQNPAHDEDSGLVVITDWASSVLPGPASATDELTQALNAVVNVSATTGNLTFATPLRFDPVTGDLTFEADTDSNGSAVFSVTVTDNGSPTGTTVVGPYTLTIKAINDPPVPRPTDAGDMVSHTYVTAEDTLRSIAIADLTTASATKDLPGPANESSQTLTVTGVAASSFHGGTVVLNGSQIDYHPALDFVGTDTFTYTIVDNGFSGASPDPRSATGTITVTVTPVNDAPVAKNDPEPGLESAYTTDEDSLLVVAGVGAIYNDTDVDSPDPADVDGTELRIHGAANSTGTLGQVAFLLEPLKGIQNGDFTYDPGTAFQNLAAFDPLNPIEGVNYAFDTFRYRISDGVYTGLDDVKLSNEATVTIRVNGVNDAPIADSISLPRAGNPPITENQVLSAIAFEGRDVDSDNNRDDLIYTIVSPTGLGTVRKGNPNANEDPRTFYFDPGDDFDDLQQSDTRFVKFTYTATDRHGAVSNIATVTITVSGQNDAPVVNDVTISTSANTATVASFDADDDDNDNTFGNLNYSVDTSGLTGTKKVTVGVANDNTTPDNGFFEFDPGTDFVSLAAGATSTVVFPYTATDAHAASASANVTVVVTGVNDAPTVQAVSIAAMEDGGAVTGTFLGDDVDTDDSRGTLVYSFIGQLPANSGTLVNNNDGTFRFNPGSDFQSLREGETRVLTFRYNARDSHQALSSTATGTITVTGKNDVPVVANLALATGENQSLTANFSGSDADTGASLTYTANALQGSGSLLNNGNSSFTFDPLTAFDHLPASGTATVTFTYFATDGMVQSGLATVAITVNGANDAPTVQNLTINAIENGPVVNSQLIGDDIDDDDNANSLTYEILSAPSAGNLVHSGGRSFSFDPGPDFQELSVNETVDVTFTYLVRDRFGLSSSTVGTVTVKVAGRNDAPVASNISGLVAVENGPAINGNFVAQDVDNDETGTGITYTVVSQPAEGTVTPTMTAAGSKAFSFAPGTAFQDLSQGQSRQVTFTYRATDTHGGSSALATVTITVNGVNDAPVAQNITGVTSVEDGSPVNITLQASDIDSDETGSTLRYSLKGGPPVGSGTVNVSNVLGNAVAVYSPGTDFQSLSVNQTTPLAFTYSATDQHGAESNAATVNIVVTGVNDAPVALNRTLTGVSEDGPAVMGSFSATDVDSDETGSTLVYSVVSPPAQGRVTVSGVTGNVTYMFDPNGEFNDLSLNVTRNVTFTYQAMDTHGAVGKATVTVTVVGTNDRPTAGTVSVAASEDGGPVTRAFAGADVDADDSQQTLNYDFTSTLTAVQGTIIKDPSNSRQFIYNPGANFQALALGEVGSAQVTYTATDRHASTSTPGTIAISITGANDAPTATSLSFNVAEGGSLTRSFGGDDIDSDDSLTSLQFTLVTQPPASMGTVTNNGGGSFTFVPGNAFKSLAFGEQGSTSFTYLARDRHGVASNVATVAITVDGVNDKPVVQNLSVSAVEDGGPVSGTFIGDDIDSDDSPSTIAFNIASQPSEGSASNSTGNAFTFNPGSAFQDLGVNESRSVTFTYVAIDSRGAVSDPATVTVTVSGVNDAPTARDDQASTFEGQVQTINVIGSDAGGADTDPDGDALTISGFQATSAKGAAISQSANSILTYNPLPSSMLNGLAAGQTTTDTFEYTVSDGRGGVSTATVTVTVTGVNNAPTAIGDLYTTTADSVLSISAPGVRFNDTDPDPGTTLSVSFMDATSLRGATITSDGNGGFTYDPTGVQGFRLLRATETLTDTFTYSAFDGSLASGLATVTITVNGVNDAPTANPETYSTSEETTLQVSAFAGVLANDRDIENDPLTVSLITSVAHGTLNLAANGSFTYTPVLNFNGNDTFSYRVSDGNSSAVATATIIVNGVNDAPVAVADQYSMNQGATLQIGAAAGVLANDSDVDDSRSSLQAIARSLPTNGGVTLFANGSFVYTPTSDFTGVSTFTYQAVDPAGARSALTTVQITVNSGNSPTTWHNSQNPFDVNNDGNVSAVDVLQIINDLNANGSRVLPVLSGAPPFLDVNNDGSVTPIDALQVINRINSGSSGEGEGSTHQTDLVALESDSILVSPVTDSSHSSNWIYGERSRRTSSPLFRVESGMIRPLGEPNSGTSRVEMAASDVSRSASRSDRWSDLLSDLASVARQPSQSSVDEAFSSFGEEQAGLLEDVIDELF